MHPGLTTTTWATARGYVRPDRPAADALVIPPASDLAFDFAEVDGDGLLVFELFAARGVDSTVLTGIDEDGFPYADPAGAAPGEEASVSIDEDGFLVFTPLEA